MRRSARKVLATVFVLGLLLGVAQPAQAECGLARLIRSISPGGFSYVQTPGLVPTVGVNSSVTTGARGSFCPDPIPDACLAVLLSDQDDGVGYFAMITKERDANANYELIQAGNAPYDLVQIPKPSIDGVSSISDWQVWLLVSGPDAASLGAGLYLDGSCGPAITGYRVVAQSLPAGAPAPEDRRRDDWTDVSPDGNPIALDAQANILIDCSGPNFATDVYLATSLVFDSGFELELVSENSPRIPCGPILAEPGDLQRKPGRKPGRWKG